MIKVVATTHEHVLAIEPRSVHALEPKPTQVGCLKHTFLLNGKPIALFGGDFSQPDFFRWVALISDHVMKVPVEFFKKSKKLADAYMERYTLRRMEMLVKADYKMGRKFAEKVGFKAEDTLETPIGAYVRYARVR